MNLKKVSKIMSDFGWKEGSATDKKCCEFILDSTVYKANIEETKEKFLIHILQENNTCLIGAVNKKVPDFKKLIKNFMAIKELLV